VTTGPVAGVAADLANRLPGQVTTGVPLADLTTYRVGGPVAVLVRVNTLDDLLACAAALGDVPVLVVGRGSNLLVADAGFPGVAIHLEGDFEAMAITAGTDGTGTVDAGGGLALPVLARRAAAAGWSGLEFFVGIPGSVGGAVRMNAGGHGCDTATVLVRATVVDLGSGLVNELTVEALDFGYRHSAVDARAVVVGATFAVTGDDASACEARIAEIVRWRREHQPGGSNAGSVFTNPPGDSAGRIIDACGLKGLRVGGASVSEKHANFFLADPDARAGDVRALIAEVQRRVADATGIELVPEIRMIGFP
jgi:UDP-N-acetylmuramate dehydrogenase